jgi:hypothetical protein
MPESGFALRHGYCHLRDSLVRNEHWLASNGKESQKLMVGV